ncbi:MAG: 3-deoxy-D-manno-octulosonic acid transferase [Candidatus Omnitrophica bacterium]|nr:3-deoxy-D-manno-octulosonic acid transferase [Candidatus Omnitrophota bacterium]
MFLLYDLLFLIYAILYLPYLLITNRGYAGYAIRFGFFPPSIQKRVKGMANIWVHAVSVGEVMVAEGFIEQLRKKFPSYQLVLTVTTKTGYALALKRLQHSAVVIPSPLDFSFVAGRFSDLINPKIYIAAETEIWPNLYVQLYRKRIPIAVINGRISDKSFDCYKIIGFILKGVLSRVSVWCMQTPQDAGRILALGAEASRVFVTGNLKFDGLTRFSQGSSGQLTSAHGELWWVAGSTHPGEEDIVLDVYAKIIKENSNWRLVIAPRHIERADKIIELATHRGFKALKFSHILNHGEKRDLDKAVIVVDTIGHLRSLYAKASLVFVGKTLRVGGGQNIIEPSFYGKAIIIGPRSENFRDIVSCFKERNALVQVKDDQAFETAVRDLCADPAKREAQGARAREVVCANQGATLRSIARLEDYLK